MIRSMGPLAPTEAADLHFSPRGEPESLRFADCYFSAEGGDEETRHVFIDGSNLVQRFENHGSGSFRIAELGFGAGLNFLLSWQTFRRCAPPNSRLHYWSVDRYPLRREALEKVLARWPALRAEASALLEAYPPPVSGVHRRILEDGRVIVDFVWADVSDALAELASSGEQLIDAWYLDGFAPRRNDAMWHASLFRRMAQSSRPMATIASYSAAGQVRRDLETAGFKLQKRPGYGRKRECISGHLLPPSAAPAPVAVRTPWELPELRPTRTPQTALVIGAGLAGSHAAGALARRGLQVTVLEATRVASGASGNAQGVLFNRLSHRRSTLSDFSLLAFLLAREQYRQLFLRGGLSSADGDLHGCLQIDAPRGDPAALAAALRELPELAAPLSMGEAAAALGVACSSHGLWQAGAGWLAPPAVCRALLAAPGIVLREQCGDLSLKQAPDGSWEALDAAGKPQAVADIVVLANGLQARQMIQTRELPLRTVRGQTTWIPQPPGPPLEASLCHRGYIAPAQNGEHCIGASFVPGDENTAIRTEEHADNLRALGTAVPAWREFLETLDPASLAGRAALRCVSPDYLPLAGPVPCVTEFRERYAALGSDGQRIIDRRGAYFPGLYLSVAHGSRGLSYAALCAELIASQVCEEPRPLSRELERAVSPARFLIRGLVRGTDHQAKAG